MRKVEASTWLSLLGGGSDTAEKARATKLSKSSESLEQHWKQWKRPDDKGRDP